MSAVEDGYRAGYRIVVDELRESLLKSDAQTTLLKLLFDDDVDLIYDALSDAMSIVMLQRDELPACMAQEVRRFVRRVQDTSYTETFRVKRKTILLDKYPHLETIFKQSGVTSTTLVPVAV
jgi:hypothetical protein